MEYGPHSAFGSRFHDEISPVHADLAADHRANDRETRGLTASERRLHAAAGPGTAASWLFAALALLSAAIVIAAAASSAMHDLWLSPPDQPGPLIRGTNDEHPRWEPAGGGKRGRLPATAAGGAVAGSVAATVRHGLLLRLLHHLVVEERSGAARTHAPGAPDPTAGPDSAGHPPPPPPEAEYARRLWR
jgi:hypothetical protein